MLARRKKGNYFPFPRVTVWIRPYSQLLSAELFVLLVRIDEYERIQHCTKSVLTQTHSTNR